MLSVCLNKNLTENGETKLFLLNMQHGVRVIVSIKILP